MTQLVKSETEATIEIAAVTQLKHALLWDLSRKVGGIAVLAKLIGVSSHTISNWINLHTALQLKGGKGAGAMTAKRAERIAAKLCKLTGKHISDIFPEFLVKKLPELQSKREVRRKITERQDRAIRYHAEVTRERLTWNSEECERLIDNETLSKRISDVLKTLPYREREIIRLRYGLNNDRQTYTLKEVAQIFKTTQERIRQLEAKAIRKLQQPVREKRLRPFLNLEDSTEVA